MNMHHPAGPENPTPSLFPIDAASVLITADLFSRIDDDELALLQGLHLDAQADVQPIGYLLHLRARSLLETADAHLVRAYRSGMSVGSVAVNERLQYLTAEGYTVPDLPDTVVGTAPYRPYQPARTARYHANSGVIERREVASFSTFLEPEAAVVLGSLRSVWKLRGFDFMKHPEADGHFLLGLRDTFVLFAGLYAAVTHQPASSPEPERAVVVPLRPRRQ